MWAIRQSGVVSRSAHRHVFIYPASLCLLFFFIFNWLAFFQPSFEWKDHKIAVSRQGTLRVHTDWRDQWPALLQHLRATHLQSDLNLSELWREVSALWWLTAAVACTGAWWRPPFLGRVPSRTWSSLQVLHNETAKPHPPSPTMYLWTGQHPAWGPQCREGKQVMGGEQRGSPWHLGPWGPTKCVGGSLPALSEVCYTAYLRSSNYSNKQQGEVGGSR